MRTLANGAPTTRPASQLNSTRSSHPIWVTATDSTNQISQIERERERERERGRTSLPSSQRQLNSVEKAEAERTEEHTAEEDSPAPAEDSLAADILAEDIPAADKRPFRTIPADNLFFQIQKLERKKNTQKQKQ